MTRILTFFALILIPTLAFSDSKVGYQIKVKVDGIEAKEAYLGYYFGDKQYLKDTAYLESDGRFYFEGNEPLLPGMYMVVLPPDNKFFQILIEEGADNQWFTMETKGPDFSGNMKIEGSADNERFYDYLNYLASKRPEADELRKKIEGESDEKKKAKLEGKLEAMDEAVISYQDNILKSHPKSMTAAIIKANQPLDVPKFEGTKEEADRMGFYWLREHWFDHIDLSDERMVRTPFLFPKVSHYVEKMAVQHPDSLIVAIDNVLEKAKPAEETFKFYLIHFLNTYAKSKLVGMDAVYVHIGKKYYCENNLAPWTDEEQLEKICTNVKKLEPLLIGEIAPDIEMQTQKGEKMKLHDFNSPYTVLFFWAYDCGHCKKSMPDMVQFAKDYKDKGVSIFSVCTSLVVRDDEGNFSMEEVDKCWDTIEEREMNLFFNTVDPYHRSRYKTVYDIRSTPQVYVLDENKKILSKRIGADQLPKVLDHILKVGKNDGQ